MLKIILWKKFGILGEHSKPSFIGIMKSAFDISVAGVGLIAVYFAIACSQSLRIKK